MKVTIESAIELSQAQLKSLTTNLEKTLGDKVQVENKVDPQIIGGIRIVTASKVVDLSLAARVNRLQETLVTQ